LQVTPFEELLKPSRGARSRSTRFGAIQKIAPQAAIGLPGAVVDLRLGIEVLGRKRADTSCSSKALLLLRLLAFVQPEEYKVELM
jgi:hypothetical protein